MAGLVLAMLVYSVLNRVIVTAEVCRAPCAVLRRLTNKFQFEPIVLIFLQQSHGPPTFVGILQTFEGRHD